MNKLIFLRKQKYIIAYISMDLNIFYKQQFQTLVYACKYTVYN